MPKDEAQSVSWMLKAAEQGESNAQFNIGASYINGMGVQRDMNEGYFWIFLANARTTDSDLRGFSESTLQTLNRAMKKDDIKNALERAITWLGEHPPRIEQ